MILIYINNNFEANITHLCPMSNGLMLSFSPADRRALWLASDNSCYSFYYLLGKGGYVFGSVGLSVCLFVCLSVNNITQKVMNGLG